MNELAVAVRGFSKVFPVPFSRRGVVAVRDLTFEVAAGQIYGLLGPNGSGKSTTLKAILGLVYPTRGTMEIFGQESASVASRACVGFLPERPLFPKYLTGLEMLRFYGKLTGLRGRRLRARASELLELVRLTNAARRRVGTYSKGMLQRIGLAQALIGNPRLLVLDEPTAGLDPAGVMAIRDLLLSLKRRGLTILLSSHLLGQVQEVCDRVAILAQGALVREGPLEELLRRDTRTQIVLENASPPLLEEIGKLATRGGAQLLACRPDQTSLERLFLEATESATPPP